MLFVHSACDCALIWQLSTSGTSTRGASAASAAQTEVRPSDGFADSREETTAFPPFIRHAPPLRAVCELCLPPVRASLFYLFFFASSAARGGALGYFLINKGSIVLQAEHTGRKATDVLYSALRRICPFSRQPYIICDLLEHL